MNISRIALLSTFLFVAPIFSADNAPAKVAEEVAKSGMIKNAATTFANVLLWLPSTAAEKTQFNNFLAWAAKKQFINKLGLADKPEMIKAIGTTVASAVILYAGYKVWQACKTQDDVDTDEDDIFYEENNN